MSDSIYAPPQADLTLPVADTGDAAFYVVSLRKFCILFIATLGMYQVYWFYKNWRSYKDRATADNGIDGDIWPVPRAIFAIFFVHALFREVDAYAAAKERSLGWTLEAHSTTLVILIIASNVLDRMSYRNIGSPMTDVLSLLILGPLLYAFYQAQLNINTACGDPRGDSNSKLTGPNIAWIVLGTIFWIMVIVGLFLPNT